MLLFGILIVREGSIGTIRVDIIDGYKTGERADI